MMFRSVLVANRGEIALRVIRACRELGVLPVAVYSEADRDAPWLGAAHEAYRLGPAAASESYLSIDRVVGAALSAGCDAVHPGYGFLAESVELARAVEEAGLTWIGPPPEAMTQMGDKLSARKTAEAAGVPLIPGTDEPTDDPAVVGAFAEEHGFPIAIKAAFGGGGRGLKVVRGPTELSDALDAAQREAVASFGRGEVYVERYLDRPRHIEAQILADAHGRCVFLGERDCSLQRRHQKLIEEAPAPQLPDDTRAALGQAAVRIAEQVGYTSTGTVEFLYQHGNFYFLEMNTRLQVEHSVSELVTGLDLVHWQLRVAAGEPLGFTEADHAPRGHAIEARINAEDVAAGFVPRPGRITRWQLPAGPGVRVDAAGEAGWEVPGDYDSLLAKVVGTGADREEARKRLLRALDELVIEGVPTTVGFHRFALTHPDFVHSRISTVSVEDDWDLSSVGQSSSPVPGQGHETPSRTITVEVAGKRLSVALFDTDRAESTRGPLRRGRGAGRAGGDASQRAALPAPIQGTIVKTVVEEGQSVAAGELVAVLEAMKMENHVTAHRAGTVTQLAVSAGDVVNAGDLIATISDE